MAASWFGTPVCMAIQMTQMMSAEPEKKSSVNQSIRADTLRLRVGSAKAARVAKAGKANSRERSPEAVLSVASSATLATQTGSNKWRPAPRP